MPYFQPLNALDVLRNRLRSELDVHQVVHAIEWGNPRVMTEALKRVRHDLGGEGQDKPAGDQLRAALLRFAKSHQVTSFSELKYVCYGSTVPIGKDLWRVIDQRPLFDALLELVNQQVKRPKQFRRCYQGLLSGYFGYERNLAVPGDTDNCWTALRSYLANNLDSLWLASSKRGTVPEWLSILSEHRNLLTTDPCSRYADSLVRDDQTELRRVCAGLGISNNSWVWEEALMAYVKRVCQSSDAGFKKHTQSILDLVNGKTSLKLPTTLSIRATAQVVARYARCADHPEQPVLRDTCVEWIGNPWLKRTAWDATVNYEPARLMVNSWLKQRLIKDFFGLLAADGAADLRRLDYWLTWEPQISDMWFVLGSDAQTNRTPEFLELRKRMSGRDRVLVDNNHLNNAFVMRIGQLLVIEFGVTGNACYVFAASDFRTSLDRAVLNLHQLKQKADAKRLSHMASWEPKFDYELKHLLQSVPMRKGELKDFKPASNPSQPSAGWRAQSTPLATPEPIAPVTAHLRNSPTPTATAFDYAGLKSKPVWPSPSARTQSVGTRSSVSGAPSVHSARQESSVAQPTRPNKRLTEVEFSQLQLLFKKHGVEWEDNRQKGGALWALIPDKNQKPNVGVVLELFQFRFTEGKGYWLKEED
ncbi:EH signature domain-containing protein [Curvibacter sp. HBC61]|uniref:EH signature domain-containing protein n=1 Tax=Curvibacter cyanobacteriorum TaxID=3026422 RepID=A0ABT5MXK0_9BURK|nr:EH signature domain-containing protein [Curvibacter sp. HBC61]MDD0838755.1 EH signature domain-containing protein [Curvibacter sp. HBC61]